MPQYEIKDGVGIIHDSVTEIEEDAFCDCAVEGMKHILQGKTKSEAYKAMLDKYDEVIKSISFKDKIRLLRDKERLKFEGEDNTTIANLK